MTLERRTPLKRSPIKRTNAQLQRAAFKRRQKRKKNEFSTKVKEQVRARAMNTCEFPGCTKVIRHFHHRRRRSQGGSGEASNCLGLCLQHHDYIHDHPAESYENGWLLHAQGAWT